MAVTTTDDLESIITHIRAMRKKRKISRSRLSKHLYEILELHIVHNASCADIALFLRSQKRIKVSRQSVNKFINQHLSSINNG